MTNQKSYILSPQAENDLARIYAYIARDNLDAHSMQQEAERQDKMAEERQKITSQFIEIAKNLESQIEKLLTEVESKVYGEIDKQIAAARQQEESAIAASNTWVKQLAEIRQDFESILSYITKATENAVNLVT